MQAPLASPPLVKGQEASWLLEGKTRLAGSESAMGTGHYGALDTLSVTDRGAHQVPLREQRPRDVRSGPSAQSWFPWWHRETLMLSMLRKQNSVSTSLTGHGTAKAEGSSVAAGRGRGLGSSCLRAIKESGTG